MVKVKMVCETCGKEIERSKSQISRHNFCSIECAYKFNRGENSVHWKGGEVSVTCNICGKLFTKKRCDVLPENFCSRECKGKHHSKVISGKKNPRYVDKVSIKCDNCGKEIKRYPREVFKKNFCDQKCLGEYRRGKNNPFWNGGSSFFPYCEKFNDEFRSRVRAFFGYKCVECGMPEEENGRKLSVHHVHYDKSSCCSDAPHQFVTLCQKCHARTNTNKEYWKRVFEELLEEKYGGKSYFTREEMELLKPDE